MNEPHRLDEPIVTSVFLAELLRDRLVAGAVALEIGCGPGSTPHLAAICADCGVVLHAVDTSATKLAMAREQTRVPEALRQTRSTGEDFLRRLGDTVSFAYLDNYDWVDSAADRSGHYPPGLSRRESELVHLEQTLLLRPKLAPRALVLFDDTWFLEREPPASHRLRDPAALTELGSEEILRRYDVFGKGSVAVPYLLSQGFRLVAFAERPASTQVLVRSPEPGETLPAGPYAEGYFEALLHEHRLVTYPSGGARLVVSRARVRALWALRELRSRARLRTRLRSLRGGSR